VGEGGRLSLVDVGSKIKKGMKKGVGGHADGHSGQGEGGSLPAANVPALRGGND